MYYKQSFQAETWSSIMACVRIEGENTEDFDVKTGLRHSAFCPQYYATLFNITLDYIMNRAMEGKEGFSRR